MIEVVSIEILGTVLQHQCDEQHGQTQRHTVALLTNTLTSHVTSLHQSLHVPAQVNAWPHVFAV